MLKTNLTKPLATVRTTVFVLREMGSLREFLGEMTKTDLHFIRKSSCCVKSRSTVARSRVRRRPVERLTVTQGGDEGSLNKVLAVDTVRCDQVWMLKILNSIFFLHSDNKPFFIYL